MWGNTRHLALAMAIAVLLLSGLAPSIVPDPGSPAAPATDRDGPDGRAEYALWGLADPDAPQAPAAHDLLALADLLAARERAGHTTEENAASLRAAATLLGTAGPDVAARTTQTLAIALTHAQTLRLGVETPTTTGLWSDDAPAAVLALLAYHGVVPDTTTLASVLALAQLEPALEQALATLIVTFLAYQQADAAVETVPDLALVLAARRDLIIAGAELDAVLARLGPGKSGAPLQIGNILSLDLGTLPQDYGTQHFMLLVDGGGDDTYRNNAGGSGIWVPRCGLTSGRGAAALFDFRGDDRYISGLDCGANGGGWGGSGLLYDARGKDVYRAGGGGTNGGAYQLGTGLILDLEGKDVYEAGSGSTNGGAETLALGGIVDRAGTDTYLAGAGATNGGARLRGYGLLFDEAGNDQFIALGGGTNGGGRELGAGLLVDAAGDDVYLAGSEATNGGGDGFGFGVLVDRSGADLFRAGGLGANGAGARAGVGVLVDSAGNDRYEAGSFGANGGAHAGGLGLLVDHGGDDHYDAGDSGVNGGANPGADARDRVCVGTVCAQPEWAWGMLLDAGGRDRFEEDDPDATGSDVTLLPKGQVGVQLDLVPALNE